MVGYFLVVQMPHARDKGRMAVLPGSVDDFFLRLEVAERVVGVILHHKVFNRASLRTALGACFHIDIRHPSKIILPDVQYDSRPAGNLDRISWPRLCEKSLGCYDSFFEFGGRERRMSGFVEGIDRSQSTLFPAMLDDYVAEDNLVRAVDAFVEGLDLGKLGFGRVAPLEKGRPSYRPATLLKIYIYGYLNRVPSSRRLERECQRNIELIWLTGQLAPDFKTIADFRKDNGKAIREVGRTFVALCRELDLLSEASVAIDGSKFKAINARDKNFTEAKMKRRLERIDESIARYMTQLETADRRGDAVPEVKVVRLRHKIVKLREEVARLSAIKAEMMKSEDKQISLTDPDARSMATSGKDTEIVGYNVQAAVDTKNHLIVAHEVTNVGTDRHQLSNMAEQARAEMGVESSMLWLIAATTRARRSAPARRRASPSRYQSR